MSEQRVAYDAFGNDEQCHAREDHVLLWKQQQGNSVFSSDIVLLHPLFQSIQADDDSCSPCLHLIRLPDASLGLCNILTEHRCACCHCPMCEQHQSEQRITLPDMQGVWHEEQYTARLCATCALLPRETRYALHAFVRTINCQHYGEEETRHAHQQKDQA